MLLRLSSGHRSRAGFVAICERFLAVRFSAVAFPPFLPPNLPSATACGFSFVRILEWRVPSRCSRMAFSSTERAVVAKSCSLLERLGIIRFGTVFKALFLAPISLALFACVAQAAPQKDLSDCVGTNFDTTKCISEHYKNADADLNVTFQKALKSAADYGPKDVAKLRDAQRKWVAYRDAECEAEYSLFGGGSGGPAAHSGCLLRITEQRIEDLKAAYTL
jgi:uncharacterized protein YecT (DUF1311 family)